MGKLKLIKLLYLSERAYLLKHTSVLTGDKLMSLPYGPVLSKTLSLIDNRYSDEVTDKLWATNFKVKNNIVKLTKTADVDKLYYYGLSPAGRKIMDEIWQEFEDCTSRQLIDYTHDPNNCGEWKDPNGSSKLIKYEDVFLSANYSEAESKKIGAYIRGN